MAAQPGSDMPSASASAFMVEAVPMVLQWPIDGADDATMIEELLVVDRGRRRAPGAPTRPTVPEPARSPFHQPLSIGPPESTIAGVFTVAAAMIAAGVVLSQPVVSTTPSSG